MAGIIKRTITRVNMAKIQLLKSKPIKAEVEVLIMKEEDTYVAYCPALDLSSYGETEKKALREFGLALDIFMRETDRKGTLERILLKLGWSLQQRPNPVYEPPKFDKAKLHRLFKSNAPKVVTEEISVPV
jgi:predicted RNase H-like HicB family nuclease